MGLVWVPGLGFRGLSVQEGLPKPVLQLLFP